MKNQDQCAFSCITAKDVAGAEYSGLTKREYIASLAMQGLLASNHPCTYGHFLPEDVASHSVKFADALLAELEKPAK